MCRRDSTSINLGVPALFGKIDFNWSAVDISICLHLSEWHICIFCSISKVVSTLRAVSTSKNRNRSINKFKNLVYDRWLQYEQPRKESGLCCFQLARYLQKYVTQIYRDLDGDAMLVPIRMGTNMAAGNQQKHLSLSFATKNVHLSLEELKNIKIILYKNRSDSQISRNKSRNKSLLTNSAVM